MRRMPPAPASKPPMMALPPAGSRQYRLVIPIAPHTQAVLDVPFPLSEANWDQLMAVLAAMKPGLVTTASLPKPAGGGVMAGIPPVIIQVKAELDEASLAELREKLRSALATGQQMVPDQRRVLIAAVRGSCACGSCKDYLAELINSGDGGAPREYR